MKALSVKRILEEPGAWSVASTLMRVGGTLLVLPIALTTLTEDLIGVYYLFITLVALGQLLDLGFNQTFSRFITQSNSGAQTLRSFGISNTRANAAPNIELLKSLYGSNLIFYSLIGFFTTLFSLIVFGYFVETELTLTDSDRSILLCWYAFSLVSGFSLFTEFWRTFLFGLGNVVQAHKVSIAAHGLATVVTITMLLNGGGLWSFPLGKLTQAVTTYFLSKRYLKSVAWLAEISLHWERSILLTMWPTAWRQGMIAIGEFLIGRGMILVCGTLFGLGLTAQYGLSLQVLGVFAALCSAPLSANVPRFNKLRVQGSAVELKAQFLTRLYTGLVVFFLLVIIFQLVGPWALERIGANTTTLEPGQFFLLSLAIGLTMHHNGWILFVLTENQNPFVTPILLTGVLTILVALLLGQALDFYGILIAQIVVPLLFLNWWPTVRGLQGIQN